jgi:hypothetical protein
LSRALDVGLTEIYYFKLNLSEVAGNPEDPAPATTQSLGRESSDRWAVADHRRLPN